jgi:hypothetical protein
MMNKDMPIRTHQDKLTVDENGKMCQVKCVRRFMSSQADVVLERQTSDESDTTSSKKSDTTRDSSGNGSNRNSNSNDLTPVNNNTTNTNDITSNTDGGNGIDNTVYYLDPETE